MDGANVLVRHVLVHVGKEQQKFQHAIALARFLHRRFVVEVVHHGKRISEESLVTPCCWARD